jgi:Domain of unknown function (DUF1788)
MLRTQHYNTPLHFESLFNIISSPRFLNKEGLGGEIPFFIHSFPIHKQGEVENHIQSLIKRLENRGIAVHEINLYQLCMAILKRENLFDTILERETSLPKQRLMRVLAGPLSIDAVVIPEIHKRLAESSQKIIFLTGIGAAFPFIRSHTILNNLQTLVDDLPLVLFFPGTYNNQSLTLFDLLKDDNYYRAHNLNEYKI